MRTDIPIIKAGHIHKGWLYQGEGKRDRFLIPADVAGRNFLIDFKEKEIGTMGIEGISVFTTRDQRASFVISPSTSMFGNTLNDGKYDDTPEGTKDPVFKGKSVKFEWW